MSEERRELRNIVEAALFVAESPLSVKRIQSLFPEDAEPSPDDVLAVLHDLLEESGNRGIELREIEGGWRFQTRDRYSPWLNRLFERRPPRYSRALLETLAIIAYRQPVTRGDVEEIRGVAVSSDIMRTLQDRDWVKVVGQRDVPGRPSLYATTRGFLEYFNLRSLSELPDLAEQRDIDEIAREMNLTLPFPTLDGEGEGGDGDTETVDRGEAAGDGSAEDDGLVGAQASSVTGADADADGEPSDAGREAGAPEADGEQDAVAVGMGEDVEGTGADGFDAETAPAPGDVESDESADRNADAGHIEDPDSDDKADARPALRVVAGTAVAPGEPADGAVDAEAEPTQAALEAVDDESGAAGRRDTDERTPGGQDDEPERGQTQDRGEGEATRAGTGAFGGREPRGDSGDDFGDTTDVDETAEPAGDGGVGRLCDEQAGDEQAGDAEGHVDTDNQGDGGVGRPRDEQAGDAESHVDTDEQAGFDGDGSSEGGRREGGPGGT